MTTVATPLVQDKLDISFDFRTDTPPAAEPDVLSPTLRKYHKRLWSKRLPSGALFELDDTQRAVYLRHKSELGDFVLSSDSVIPTFRKQPSLQEVFRLITRQERACFLRESYTMGGMMVFPGNRVDGKMTINAARGCHPKIKDRFELTLECIRRHYAKEPSPLSDTLVRYTQFFSLFGSFQGYVRFFLPQDLVTADRSAVKFFHPFTDFTTCPVPKGFDNYRAYSRLAMAFIRARNIRIAHTL